MRFASVIALLAALVFASSAAAKGTLVFERGSGTVKPSIWMADVTGGGAQRLATGYSPRISNNGGVIVYSTLFGTRRPPRMLARPVAGGAARVLLDPWWNQGTFAWSPDSRTIAALTGRELGPQHLELIDVNTGERRSVATGYFSGVGFSPASDAVVYSRAARDVYPPKADLYVAPTSGGAPRRLTTDRASVWPVWGPADIVFARVRKARRRDDSPKQDLYLVKPDGTNVRRLTRTKVPFLLTGLSPTAWSDAGDRLLAEFGGQDTSFAETVNPLTGKVRMIGRSFEQGIVGFDISHDGSTILGATGGFDPSARHDVVSIPYAGGKRRVLVRNAFSADWTL